MERRLSDINKEGVDASLLSPIVLNMLQQKLHSPKKQEVFNPRYRLIKRQGVFHPSAVAHEQ